MPYKLVITLLAMVVVGASILVMAVGSLDTRVTDLASKVINIDIPNSTGQGTCTHDAEILAITHSLDADRLAMLAAALQNLHDTTQDPLWQPITDLFKPKAIRLNPHDFSTSYSDSSVEINRQVKRITVNYPRSRSDTEQAAVYLTYDLRIDHNGRVEVVENSLYGNTSLPKAIYSIKERAFHNIDESLDGGRVSDCAVKALPIILPELSWQTTKIIDRPYCRLQGLHNNRPVIGFNINCPESLS